MVAMAQATVEKERCSKEKRFDVASRKHVARVLYMEWEEYHENNQRDAISKGEQTEHVDDAEIKSRGILGVMIKVNTMGNMQAITGQPIMGNRKDKGNDCGNQNYR